MKTAENWFSQSNSLLYTITIAFLSALQGQEVSTDSRLVYQEAYETAVSNGHIDENEQAILNTLRTSLGLSSEQIAEIEANVQFAPVTAEAAPEQLQVVDQSGRWPLVAQNMIYAASLYGWMVPYVLDAQDPKWYIGSEMMSLGVAFYLTYKYTKNMEISHARAQMMRAGSAAGLAYGRGINTLLDLDFDLFGEDSNESKLGAWILMASIPAGIYVGDKLYDRWHPSNGQAWSLTLWGEIGTWTVRALHLILEAEPEEPEPYRDWVAAEETEEHKVWEEEHKKWGKTHRVFDMAGYPLGTYVGRRFFGEKQYTFGDALMLIQGRSLGWLYAVMLTDILDVGFEDPGARFFRIGGTIGGTLLFDRFIEGYDYTFGQSILTILGTASGMAFAGGSIAILEIDEHEVIESLIMTGGVAGLYLANSILKLRPESKTATSTNNPTFSITPSFQLRQNGQTGLKYVITPTVNVGITF